MTLAKEDLIPWTTYTLFPSYFCLQAHGLQRRSLLKYYARRIGNTKYYSMMACPLIFFIAQFGVPILKTISPAFELDPFTEVSYVLILSTLIKPIGGRNAGHLLLVNLYGGNSKISS